MTLPLSRIDYTAVGVTSKGTTKIFPATEHRQTQKFAVADHDGILHVYGIKKGELQVSFKSLPGPRINKLVLAGSGRDKIYIAQGNTVRGFTKKGKLFLEFDTNLIDPISSLHVLGPDLAACARDLYHRYHDCKDADSYLAGEILNDVVLLPTDSNFVFAILACGDCAIRVLHGTKSPAVLRLPSVPTVLSLQRDGDVDSKERVLVGTVDGKVGLLILQGTKTLRITWLLNTTGPEITSLDTYKLQDGLDILIGRQDGAVEVYTFPEEDMVPLLRYRHNANESVTSVMGGVVGAAGYPEVLVTTYSGRIFGLTTRPPGLLEIEQNDGLAKLRTEIQQLQEKLNEEKETGIATDSLAPLILSVNHRMVLKTEDASYSLSVELDTPIDNILIQSDTPIQLLDVESNSAVVSLSACNPKEGNFVLATYRCQVNTNHLEMRLRTIEGQPGTLQIYVTSQVQPKCCRKIQIPICSLSLHVRQHQEENAEGPNGGPFNELRLVGSFTTAEMHAWLSLVLPDVPERPHLEEGEATLTYVSAFIGTLLKCKYKKGSATFLGENISSIIILRDVLTREATKRKIKLDVFCDVVEGSLTRVLELILPRLNAVHGLITKIKILNALEEWELKENPKENLCSEYQELVQNEGETKSQMARDNELLERLHAMIVDLYVDWERAKRSRRISSKEAAGKLSAALESRDLSQLLHVFVDSDDVTPLPSVPSIII
ncbi:Bardet-Biedl syndrome 7 protein homolog isoform X2 [Ceratina calcarata]|uniref:Bardet-Biedl syndrome 7 protein homolog isoform X2 n=1 Tax=Ceratina calcarata TaxID=156304 RepID=A0AAJ7IV65_9HYME|nr:Bardet-Biedl syndrome 7 protein homolog isoform X2 [Ceratina calcarata]